MLACPDYSFTLFQGVGNNLGFTKRPVIFQLLKAFFFLLRNVILHYTLPNGEILAERTCRLNNSCNSQETAQVYDTTSDLFVSSMLCVHKHLFSEQRTDSW